MTKRPHDPVVPDAPDATTGSTEIAPVEDTPAPAPATVPEDASRSGRRNHDVELPDTTAGRLGSAWVGLVLGALVTILLLIFIAQNTASTAVRLLGLQFSLPLGVLILFASIAGALIMALFAGFRILQLRMRARKTRKLTSRRH
ncbi:lipopolysaccharide assembly LapA domain-containing protein [Dietzia sp. UBA5065]|uniref:LapA family protein n=1 Tax=Dietzia sp. UBA5065 TaxID=1946422 RepID=UPI0025C70D26|nr:lipopolysaccharide assembly protein LapA domain-containing protein [Dietzia sp. UBA5065]